MSHIFPERVNELATLDCIFDDILVKKGGWDKFLVYTQEGGLKVWAYRNSDEPLDNIGFGTIHGTEEIGGIAWADSASKLVDLNRRTLLIPCANKWGFLHLERYSPNGQSVGDAGDFFGFSRTPATPESDKFIQFLHHQKLKPEKSKKGVLARTRVLDIHEDSSWDDSLEGLVGLPRERALNQINNGIAYHSLATLNSHDSQYTYFYYGCRDDNDHSLVNRLVDLSRHNGNHLPRSASTRFAGEVVVNGVVWNSEDLSMGHLMTFLGASTFTTEIIRRTPRDPTLAYRRRLQGLLIDAFLGVNNTYRD